MVRATFAAAALCVLAPVCALAAAAGFAPGALWLSSTSATAGDSLKVYTVIYDSTSVPIQGDVEFDVDSTLLSAQHFSLSAGRSQIVSADWTAVEGMHSFSATLKDVTGVSTVAQAKTDAVHITVAPPPPSPVSQVTSVVNNFLASSSPQTKNVVQAVAAAAENVRKEGASALESALARTAQNANPQVLGTSTSSVAAAAQSGFANTLWRAVLTGLLYVFQVQWLFYAALLVVCYLLFKIVQGFFRYRRS